MMDTTNVRCKTRRGDDRITISPSNEQKVVQHPSSWGRTDPFRVDGCDDFTNELVPVGLERGEDITIGDAVDWVGDSKECNAVVGVNV